MNRRKGRFYVFLFQIVYQNAIQPIEAIDRSTGFLLARIRNKMKTRTKMRRGIEKELRDRKR